MRWTCSARSRISAATRCGSGYSRHVYDEPELALRVWVRRTAAGLGLAVETDRNGNIWAHWGPRGPHTIAVGSHMDSVPGGGAYDGPLGVASALAAVSHLMAEGFQVRRPRRELDAGQQRGHGAAVGERVDVGGSEIGAVVDVCCCELDGKLHARPVGELGGHRMRIRWGVTDRLSAGPQPAARPVGGPPRRAGWVSAAESRSTSRSKAHLSHLEARHENYPGHRIQAVRLHRRVH